jgi:hypothetical protein
MQIMRKKLLERKLLRQRLSKLNKILMVNNAVERVHNARNLAVYRASKGLVHSVQRSNRWHFFMTMFKMTRVFTSMQENEVGGLDECIEYLKTKCDELLAECEERKAKTAVKSDELRMVWGQLHESLDPQQLALLEVSDEYDLSAARLQVLEFMLGDAKIEVARRVILSEEEMTECEHLMALMDITPVSPLYARRSELHGRGVLDTQMTALHRKLVHLQVHTAHIVMRRWREGVLASICASHLTHTLTHALSAGGARSQGGLEADIGGRNAPHVHTV